ncbi:farnesol dehydrogenase isoform X1 [Nasonia vitripennis]|uniref:Uncharacterized protein n=1 Tax=Nasonia vitripennis TaxID=7425 RepID=A0A7M7QPP6_NASVI|nr:farnesol dehydrogenase isoform X1 [Nasonia vitripennis]XP_032452066.1 farnesol dehydrogenase isoform X1 [Nasonia vitripennis]
MDRWMGKVAVVTGASAGIGLLTAEALVRHGMVVVGLARRKAKMDEGMKNVQEKGKFHAVECDVTKEDNVIKVFDYIKNKFGSVHVLVNNAGGMTKGATTDLSSEELKKIIDLNIVGLLYCTRQAVNLMKESKQEGHIINVGSILGHRVAYIEKFYFNVYPATKFAVRALTETMKDELRDYPIRFTHISPGVVKTEFFDVAGADPSMLEVSPALNSEDVADAIVYVIGTKPHVHIPELSIRHMNDYYK